MRVCMNRFVLMNVYVLRMLSTLPSFFQWDLVCGQEGYVDTVQLFFFLGALVSAIPHGVLADHFGRKYVHLGSLWGLTILGVATAFAPNYYLHVTLRAITGALYQVRKATSFCFMKIFFPQNQCEKELISCKVTR